MDAAIEEGCERVNPDDWIRILLDTNIISAWLKGEKIVAHKIWNAIFAKTYTNFFGFAGDIKSKAE